jgi:hypothetical protein
MQQHVQAWAGRGSGAARPARFQPRRQQCSVRAPSTSGRLIARASSQDDSQTPSGISWGSIVGVAMPAAMYAVLIFYTVKYAPNQTPLRDQCAL